MKIGMFTDNYPPLTDGVAFSVEDFKHELEKLGHEVYVFAPRTSLRQKSSSHIIRFPAVKGLFYEDYLFSLFFPPGVVRRIDKLDLDIVHFHTPGQIGLMGAYYALQRNIPLVTTYHTDYFEYVKHYPNVLPGTIALAMLAPLVTHGGMQAYRASLSSIRPERSIDKWNQKIVKRGITMINNQCDLVIAPSKKMKDMLTKWKTEPPIEILPTGVDKITTTTRELTAFRRKFNLNADDNIILFVGRIGTEKNIDLLLRAFTELAPKDPRAKLVLVGHGDDMDSFREQANKSTYGDRITFTGRIDRKKLGAAYSCSKVFAFPSLGDTQGIVLSEASLAGLPIVMIDQEISEVVLDNKNGYFAKNNAKDFASKLLKVLRNEKHRIEMGRQGIELAKKFSAGKQGAKLLRLYKETIENHHDRKHSLPQD